MVRILTGRRLLITGASSGIGCSLATEASSRGARVALAARSADRLEQLAQSLTRAGGKAVAIPADVTCAADRKRLLERVAEEYGGLDVLVNNAGAGSFG